MFVKRFLLGAVVCISLPAVAEIVTITRAYEIPLSEFMVPATPNGAVTFRECSECDARIIRITPATLFVVNGQNVGLKEFRQNVFQIRDRAGETIIVMHHLESDTITEVSVSI